MGFDEGSIVLNSANETYYPGQTIYGKLQFTQDKVKTFRGLFVKIKGFCKVHWTTHHTRREHGRTRTYTISHDSFEEYFSEKVYLLGGENGEYHLQPGEHEFSFECLIPANCPSSFEGSYGHVRYEIKCVVDRPFKIDQEKKIRIRVIAPLDLNAEPYCKEPMQFDMEDSYCCCCMKYGSSETVVKLPLSGYCPGQVIPVEVACSNQGRVEIDTLKLTIKKRATFHATKNPDTRHESETVAEIKKGPIPGGATRSWMVDMEVPALDVYNMESCRYIFVDYDFKVTVSPEGCRRDNEDSKRIVIGTIPLVGQQDNVMNPLQDQMPIINQPTSTMSPYPPSTTYPDQNSPYPGSYPSYPGVTAPYPGANSPYPVVTPYPNTASPYPAGNSPYPGGPNQPSVPYPRSSPSSSLRTGTFGFAMQEDGKSSSVPLLPPGSVPYPTTSPNNPYAIASAPEPATPVDENKADMGENATGSPLLNSCPAYNPEYVDKENEKK